MRRTTEENLREREGVVLGQYGTGGVNRRIHRHAGGGLERNPRGARPDERHAAGGVRTLLDCSACVKDEARFGVYNLRARRRGWLPPWVTRQPGLYLDRFKIWNLLVEYKYQT